MGDRVRVGTARATPFSQQSYRQYEQPLYEGGKPNQPVIPSGAQRSRGIPLDFWKVPSAPFFPPLFQNIPPALLRPNPPDQTGRNERAQEIERALFRNADCVPDFARGHRLVLAQEMEQLLLLRAQNELRFAAAGGEFLHPAPDPLVAPLSGPEAAIGPRIHT